MTMEPILAHVLQHGTMRAERIAKICVRCSEDRQLGVLPLYPSPNRTVEGAASCDDGPSC